MIIGLQHFNKKEDLVKIKTICLYCEEWFDVKITVQEYNNILSYKDHIELKCKECEDNCNKLIKTLTQK
jgi:hypothetical protein